MSLIFYYFFIAVGLSMDAFSLAIIYGMNNLKMSKILTLSIVVGIFHFFMPNISALITNLLVFDIKKYASIISGIVFLILAIEMILSFKDTDTKYGLDNYLEIILFSFAVSLDSFSVGAALSLDGENLPLAGLIFSIVSFIFTLLGLILGKKFTEKVGSISKIIGIIILLLLSIKYFLV